MMVVIGAYGTIKNVDSFVERLLRFSKEENLVIQAFDATVVYGKDHLISATNHAQRAFEQGRNATNSLALEILLYAAGERQIQKAIKKMGVKTGKQLIAFVFTNDVSQKKQRHIDDAVIKKFLGMFHLTSDDKVLEGDRNKLIRFGFTDQELSTTHESKYGDLILEKVALVDIIK